MIRFGKHITTLLLLALPIVGCKKTVQEGSPVQAQPNIIYILADDLGYGDIGAFNPYGKIKTPAIDQLAAEGMRFTDAHTSSAVCTPTRYGILTGRYNWRSPLKSSVLTGASKALIPKERTTVASLLKKQGYHTAFIGKWHLGWDWALKSTDSTLGEGWNHEDFNNIDFSKPIANGPNSLGFDYAYGHSGSLDMAPYVYVENGKATMVPDSITEDTGKYTWWRKGPTSKDFIHEDVTPNFFRKSFAHIKERANKEEPFFLYLALPSPHTPILPTEEWQGKSDINPYADFMMMIDDYMGQLAEVLKETGIEEETMVIFTSDNGCSPQADFAVLAEKGHDPSYVFRGHKADIYEGGHRVPFIVKWPQKVQPGSSSDQTICTTDFFATVAEITGAQPQENEGEDSFSMLPLLMGSPTSNYGRTSIVHHSINGSFALRKGKWKLIFAPGSGGWSSPKPNSEEEKNLPAYQLYDLTTDIAEQQNLQDEYPEIVEELKAEMASLISNGRSTPGSNQSNEMPLNGKSWEQIAQFTDENNSASN